MMDGKDILAYFDHMIAAEIHHGDGRSEGAVHMNSDLVV
ncbi:acetyl/propionyl-CoA carboxylase alpha subunit [Paenibacillus sp. DS2015]